MDYQFFAAALNMGVLDLFETIGQSERYALLRTTSAYQNLASLQDKYREELTYTASGKRVTDYAAQFAEQNAADEADTQELPRYSEEPAY